MQHRVVFFRRPALEELRLLAASLIGALATGAAASPLPSAAADVVSSSISPKRIRLFCAGRELLDDDAADRLSQSRTVNLILDVNAPLLIQTTGDSLWVSSSGSLSPADALHVTQGDETLRLEDSSDGCSAGAVVIQRVWPAAGPVSGGTTVALCASGLVPGCIVRFGSTMLSGLLSSQARDVDGNPGLSIMSVVSPPHAPGVVEVRVSLDGGATWSRSHGHFTYHQPGERAQAVRLAVAAQSACNSTTAVTARERTSWFNFHGGGPPGGSAL